MSKTIERENAKLYSKKGVLQMMWNYQPKGKRKDKIFLPNKLRILKNWILEFDSQTFSRTKNKQKNIKKRIIKCVS